MHKAIIAGATIAALVAGMTVVATGMAGSGPRLAGKFETKGPVQATDISGVAPGLITKDTYTFTSKCAKGGCAKVKLSRDAGVRNVKSTLHRTAPGRYQGSEGPTPYTCLTPFGDPGTFTAVNKVRVTKSKKGRATKIAGSIRIKINGCTETFENARFTGKLSG